MDKLSSKFAYAALVGAAVFSSCSKDTNLYDDNRVEKEYSANFVNTFGNIAADQDWDAATRGSVNVTTLTSSEVKIYALVDSVYRLVGDYEGVSGTQKLEFDLPKGVEDIMVNTNAGSVKAKVGGNAAFSETRAAYAGTTNDVTISDYTETNGSDGVELTKDNCKVIFEKLKEGENNLGKVTQNFYLTSDKDIVIYPIYWKTSQTLTVGVYYIDADGNKVETDVYTMKDTDTDKAKLLVKQDIDGETKTSESDGLKYTQDTKGSTLELFSVVSQNSWNKKKLTDDEQKNLAAKMVELKFFNDGYTFSNFKITKNRHWTVDGEEIYGGDLQYDYTSPTVHDTDWKIFYDSKSPDYAFIDNLVGDGKILSKGIRISLPANKQYGMYIKRASDSVKLYSEQKYNDDGQCHAAIYKKNNKTYLGFEDWYNGGDNDLNDFVFMIKNVERQATKEDTNVEIHDKDQEEEPFTWILACEDLGSTNDYDFNDVVLGISYVSGKEKATITPLAAGGTLKAVVKFGDDEKMETLGEIHEWLGANVNADGKYPVINANTITNSGKVKTVKVAKNYSISNSAGSDNLGKIKIEVTNGTTSQAQTISAPTIGEVPQMLVINSDWEWPIEGTRIEDAYTGFPKWVGNSSYNWGATKVANKVVSRSTK